MTEIVIIHQGNRYPRSIKATTANGIRAAAKRLAQEVVPSWGYRGYGPLVVVVGGDDFRL